MERAGRRGVQRVLLVPPTGADPDLTAPRRAVVLTAPDAPARSRAAQLGIRVEVCPELGPAPPGDVPRDRADRLDAVVRQHAVADRWRDLVVVADAQTLQGVATGLCALPEPPAVWDDRGVVTIGLPRGPRPVRLLPTLLLAAALALLTLSTLTLVHPALLPAAVAGTGLVLTVWGGTRHVGRTLLAAAGLAAVLVFVLVAGSTRFPVE